MKKQNYISLLLIFSAVIILYPSGVYAQKISSGKYRITPETLNPKPISPLIYGHFIELGFGRQIEGMWAEKLYNPSFEIIEPYKTSTWGWLMKSPGSDLTKEEWWHSGYERVSWYAALQGGRIIPLSFSRYSGFYHGLQAATLDNRQNKERVYLAQDSVWVKKGIKNIFTGAVKINRQAQTRPIAAGPAGGAPAQPAVSANTPPTPVSSITVRVGLYLDNNFSKPVAEKILTVKETFYEVFSTELDCGNYNGRATFAVSIDPGVSASFDGFSLMPADAINGWRKDAIAALKQIGVPIIRWPGGCFDSFYHWRNGVGPKAERMPVTSEYWGDIEENNIGIVEFVQLCRMLNSEPFVGVNMLTGSASEAADWVAYTNGNKGDRMSNLRKEHGYPDPLNVKYWELDNETSRRWGYREYAEKCIQFSKAMKAVDPEIELVMVYYSFRGYLKELLDIAGKHIDLITDRSGTEEALKEDLAVIDAYNKKNGTNIRLCNTEWLANTRSGFGAAQDALDKRQVNTRMTRQQHQISWNYAMNTVYQLFTFQRLGNDFLWSNFNNMANTWGQNIIECPRDTVFISSAGKVFELMSKSQSAWVLKTDTITGLKGVFVQATTNSEKDRLILYMLNYQPVQSQVNLDLSSFKISSKEAVVKTVNADGPFSANTSADYNKIKSATEVVKVSNAQKPLFSLKPWSVTEITLKL